MKPDDRSRSGTGSSSQAIYETIRERVSLLEYPPGMVLSESALAREFNVSRTPVRAVLQRLEFDGLVESKRGIGTLVTSVDLKYLQEVYAFRMKLHEMTGQLCPSVRVLEEDIAVLEDLLVRAEAMHDRYDPPALARLYNEFQNHVVRLISNRPLREISDRLYYQTSRVWVQILPDLNWTDEVAAMCDEISQVTQALRACDMEAFGQVRRNDLYTMLGRIKRYLGGANELELL